MVSPVVIPVAAGDGNLNFDSLILCHQIRTLDRRRVMKILGSLSPVTLRKAMLGVMLAIGYELSDAEVKEILDALNP
uniref:PemK-like protein n=1 Tax=mine drainage metagenome TaxID=410659 RepID=E6PJB0_9ZZZZ